MRLSALRLHRILGACLAPKLDLPAELGRGDFPWPALLETANRTLLSPALHAALSDKAPSGLVPDDVRAYLGELNRLNALRNHRLRIQADEAIAALNRAGVVPLLLKGAAMLFERRRGEPMTRMVSDLDLLVGKNDGPRAIECLARLGYIAAARNEWASHGLGDFVRPQDVGAIDLHVELLREEHLLPAAEVLRAASPRVQRDLSYMLLSPEHRVLHLLLHDTIQDHGYFDGRLHFRHLHDLASLVAAEPGIDWGAVRDRLQPLRLAGALAWWLLAAEHFFAVPVPAAIGRPWLARARLWRAQLQIGSLRLRRLGEVAGNLHRSLAWYRLPDRVRPMPRLRHAIDYVRRHRVRTVGRVLHVVRYRRS